VLRAQKVGPTRVVEKELDGRAHGEGGQDVRAQGRTGRHCRVHHGVSGVRNMGSMPDTGQCVLCNYFLLTHLFSETMKYDKHYAVFYMRLFHVPRGPRPQDAETHMLLLLQIYIQLYHFLPGAT
jgi:hypothetical protein